MFYILGARSKPILGISRPERMIIPEVQLDINI